MASEPAAVPGTTEIVPTSILNLYPGNARRGDVDAIAGSIVANGQYSPIIVNVRDRTVLAGNHTLKAMRQLSEQNPFDRAHSHIKVHWVDVDEDQARTIVLADNQTFELGEGNDPEILFGILSEIGTTGTGYADADLDALEATFAKPAASGDTDAEPDAEPAPPSLPPHEASVIGYTLTFDDADQQEHWFAFVKMLKTTYPDLETVGERLLAHLADTESERV